jgi:hypothetical protein
LPRRERALQLAQRILTAPELQQSVRQGAARLQGERQALGVLLAVGEERLAERHGLGRASQCCNRCASW